VLLVGLLVCLPSGELAFVASSCRRRRLHACWWHAWLSGWSAICTRLACLNRGEGAFGSSD
jgi:hypothetical protein